MTTNPRRRSMIPLTLDTFFSYFIASVSIAPFTEIDLTTRLLINGFVGGIISSFLLLVRPINLLLQILIVRTVQQYAPSRYDAIEAFNSTFSDYSKSRIIGGSYLALSLLILVFVSPSQLSIFLPKPPLLVALAVALVAIYHDAKRLPEKIVAVAVYYGIIRKSKPGMQLEYIRSTANSLEAGNWGEAWSWIMQAGIPSGYAVPKRVTEV